jgi:hypothetical protein
MYNEHNTVVTDEVDLEPIIGACAQQTRRQDGARSHLGAPCFLHAVAAD